VSDDGESTAQGRLATDAAGSLGTDERAELERLRAEVTLLRARPSRPEAAPGGKAGRRHRPGWRGPVATLLIVLGCILAPVSVLAVWTANQVSDTNRYVQNVAPLIHEPAVQSALTDKITNEINAQIHVQALTNQAAATLKSKGLPRVGTLLQTFSGSLAGAVGGFIHTQVGKIVASPQVATLWVQVNRTVHAELVKALSGQGNGAITISNGQVVLNLGPFIDVVKKDLVARGFSLANNIPAINPTFALFSAKELVKAQSGYRLLNDFKIVLPILTLLLLAAGIYIARSHRRALIGAGLGTVVGNLEVLIISLLAWLVLGERPRRSLILASPVMLAGLVLVAGLAAGPGSRAYGADPGLGVGYGIGVALLYAIYILMLRQATSSPGSGGPSRASTNNLWLGNRSDHPTAGATTTTGSWLRTSSPWAWNRSSRMLTTTCDGARLLLRAAALTGTGSAVTTSSASPTARSAARCATGPECNVCTRQAPASSVAQKQARAAAATASTARRRPPERRHPTAATAAAAMPASATTRPVTGGRAVPTRAPTQPASAAGTSRRSGGGASGAAGAASPLGTSSAVIPAPWVRSRRTCARRCRPPRVAHRRRRNGRGRYGSRGSAGPERVRPRARPRAARGWRR